MTRRAFPAVLVFLVGACGGRTSTATVTTAAPPTPPPPTETVPPAEQPAPAGERPAPAADTASAGAPAPALEARGYPAAVRIGARVAEVRTDPPEVVVEVGDSLAMGEDLRIVAYDANGDPVTGVRILTVLDSRLAVLEEGFLRGVAEGEAEIRMSIRVPPASGTGPPETPHLLGRRSGWSGSPVAMPRDPGSRRPLLLAGSVVRLHARALTADGSERRTVEVEWSSDRGPPGHRRIRVVSCTPCFPAR